MTRVLIVDADVADRLGNEWDRVYAPIGGCKMVDGRTLGRDAYIADRAEWEKSTMQHGVDRAAELGHTLEADPPGGISRARRMTCSTCGGAVLVYPGNPVPYGSAYTTICAV